MQKENNAHKTMAVAFPKDTYRREALLVRTISSFCEYFFTEHVLTEVVIIIKIRLGGLGKRNYAAKVVNEVQ